jgi:hypothetical protein
VETTKAVSKKEKIIKKNHPKESPKEKREGLNQKEPPKGKKGKA